MHLKSTNVDESLEAGTRWPADVETYSNLIVNLFFVGDPESFSSWTLVDAGLPFSASAIINAAGERFGRNNPPEAIVLTHGHFDHVGALPELLRRWDVPVWAHALEAPYLTGRSSYPPPDPTVGGGMMARLSPLYPKGPIDIGDRLHLLPSDGSVPPMPGWRWIHTPGHTHGHVSLFRDSDRTLIVGDAFVTTKQESAVGAMTKFHAIHGPPMYFTSDWEAARLSVIRLAELDPASAFPGHGKPIRGRQLYEDLAQLVGRFDDLAKPEQGRYVAAPAVADESGVVSVPPPVSDRFPAMMGALAVATAMGIFITLDKRRR